MSMSLCWCACADFALQASKSHEYPEFVGPANQAACPKGEHTKVLLLCKVAAGTENFTTTDFLGKGNKCSEHPAGGNQACPKCRSVEGKAPVGCHSVHGRAHAAGSMNYDELVVYDEKAVLPYMVVRYRFTKL
jgi:hypothetical protein